LFCNILSCKKALPTRQFLVYNTKHVNLTCGKWIGVCSKVVDIALRAIQNSKFKIQKDGYD